MSVGLLLSRLAWVAGLGLLFALVYSQLFSPALQRSLDQHVRRIAWVLVVVGTLALAVHYGTA